LVLQNVGDLSPSNTSHSGRLESSGRY
jgi:hypothetical protein